MEEAKPAEEIKACPFIPPFISKGVGLNPQQPVAHMQPCLGPTCQVWSTKRNDCGCKQKED